MNWRMQFILVLITMFALPGLSAASAQSLPVSENFDDYEDGDFARQARPGWSVVTQGNVSVAIRGGQGDKYLTVITDKTGAKSDFGTIRFELPQAISEKTTISFQWRGIVGKEMRLIDADGKATTVLELNMWEPQLLNVRDSVLALSGVPAQAFAYALGGLSHGEGRLTFVLDPTSKTGNFTLGVRQRTAGGPQTELLTGTYNFQVDPSTGRPAFKGIEFRADGGAFGGQVVLDDFVVRRTEPEDVAQLRAAAMDLPYRSKAPLTVSTQSVGIYTAATFRKLADHPAQLDMAQRVGVLDVTLPPYNADPTGKTDATSAIQSAIDDAREPCLLVYLPGGEYLVSRTLEMPQPNSDIFTTDLTGNVLMGPKKGAAKRARLKLAANADGFGNPDDPRPVVHMYKLGAASTNFRQHLIDIDIEIGPGNPGAIGVHGTGAQWTTIEGVTVDAGDGLAGLHGISGAGGGVHDLTVIGGRYGIYATAIPNSSSAAPLTGPTMQGPGMSNITLIGQREAAIFADSVRCALAATGVRIEGAGIRMGLDAQRLGVDGRLSLVDAVITYNGPGPAIQSDRTVYLRNVYVRNAATIAQVQGGHTLEGNSSGWAHVKEYIGACEAKNEGTQVWPAEVRQDLVYVDGKPAPAMLADVVSPSDAPPADIQSRHYWGDDFPAWYDANTVNVKDAPYHAKGDGQTDDWAAIQKAIDANDTVLIPRGTFMISKPLRLKKHTKLIGTSINATNVLPIMPGFQGPMIDTEDAADGTAVLAWMNLLVHSNADPDGPYAIRWRVGRDSLMRGVRYERRANFSERTNEVRSQQIANVLVEGGGGGRWWNAASLTSSNSPDGRHFLFRGTREPFALYQFNPEHGHALPYVEIDDCENIAMYGMKNEGGPTIIRMRNSRNIMLTTQTGNNSGTTEHPVFAIENCDDFAFINITSEKRHHWNKQFNRIVETHDGDTTVIDGRHVIGLYKRGETNFEPLR